MTFIRRTFIPSMIKSFHTTIAMQPPKIKSNASPAVIQTSLASTNTHLSSSKPITYTTTQQPVTSTKQLPSSSRPVIVTTTNTTSVTSKSLIYSLTQKMQSSIAITDPTRVTTQVSSKTPIDFSSPETSRSNPSTSVATFDASITTTAEGPRTSIHIWTPWTTWTACNIGCRQSRYRECRSYVPQRCHGNHTKTRDCSYSCERTYIEKCLSKITFCNSNANLCF